MNMIVKCLLGAILLLSGAATWAEEIPFTVNGSSDCPWRSSPVYTATSDVRLTLENLGGAVGIAFTGCLMDPCGHATNSPPCPYSECFPHDGPVCVPHDVWPMPAGPDECWFDMIGKIGTNGQVFHICEHRTVALSAGQSLYLGVNDCDCQNHSGSWSGTLVVTEVPSVQCPGGIPGFTYMGQFGGHCYYMSNGSNTWTGARDACVAVGGYLACLTSEPENSFVSGPGCAMAPGRGFWIGLSDYRDEGHWVWESGEPYSYSNWDEGEPNNYQGLEDYVHIRQETGCQWNDYVNDEMTLKYALEYAPPSLQVASPNGGESWYTGELHNITWSSENFSDGVKIELNRSYPGPTWETIVDSTTNDGSYSWTVGGPPTTTARMRITGVVHTTVGDTSDGDFAIEPCGSGFEIRGALAEKEYYTSSETVNCNFTTVNNSCPSTYVRLNVVAISYGIDQALVPPIVVSSEFWLDQSPTPHSTGLSWPVGPIITPRGVTLITNLHRVSDGQELASAVFSTAYCAGILTNDQWQGLLTAIDECAPPGSDCALEMLGMVPVIGGVAEIPSFLNEMCLTWQNLDHGRPFEAGLHLIDGVAGGFLALAGLYNLKHANDAFEAYQSTVNCATELMEIDWHAARSEDNRTDVEILTDSLKLLPDSLADFRYQCLMQGGSDLTIVVADTAESNLDQIEITDGFVWEYPQRHIVWGYLGPHANPAGSTLANPYYACEFRHTADSAETVNVSLLHRSLDSSLIQLNWDSVQIDSAGGFRIPASDTTDCIKMFLDQDGDGVYEQIVYPEAGGASMQLVAMVDGDSIRLSWNPVYCASSYRVYWGSSLDEITTQLIETADTTCADAAIGSVRFYQVKAVFP